MSKQQLSTFSNPHFDRGASHWKELAWMLVSALLFRHSLALFNSLKCPLLRLFGAQVGSGVLIKPSVHIKFPWKLTIGDHSWIGEKVWIDNLERVTIGANVCLSQEAMLLCGNHDYTRPTFDLRAAPISLEDGCWVGARAVVCPGVNVGNHAVLAVGAIATKDLEAFMIYQGQPAVAKKKRVITDINQTT